MKRKREDMRVRDDLVVLTKNCYGAPLVLSSVGGEPMMVEAHVDQYEDGRLVWMDSSTVTHKEDWRLVRRYVLYAREQRESYIDAPQDNRERECEWAYVLEQLVADGTIY